MCDAIIVIESAERGGALITADLANDYNRDVFAVPGRITDDFSRGCIQLVRQNKAAVFESTDRFAEMMGWKDENKVNAEVKKQQQLELFDAFTDTEKTIIGILKEKGKTEIDHLAACARMPVNKVSSLLLSLEFAGVLRSLPGKVYQLK
jgi:DNA processing protein